MSKNPDWLGLELANGRYRVEAKLGEGGMGTVYRAWDHNLEDKVVIKVPVAGSMVNEEFVRRFEQEARALVKLQHPHVVRVIDVGKHQGLPFAVMQYLAGGSLRDRVPRGPNGQPLPMPVESLPTWLVQVADAIDFIHKQKFIHRDIKPANILFDGHGNVYLGDFGLAKALAAIAATPVPGMTQQGIILGTPDYMAPEVICGLPFDGKADQYALAVTVYELLTGVNPFMGLNLRAILLKQQAEDLKAPHEINKALPTELAAPIRKAMAKDSAQRFPTCTAFARAVMASVGAAARGGVSAALQATTSHAGVSAAAPQPSVIPFAATGREPAPTGSPMPPQTPPQTVSQGEASIQQRCPSCNKLARFPVQAHGRRVPCPKCKAPLIIGHGAADAPAYAQADGRTRAEGRALPHPPLGLGGSSMPGSYPPGRSSPDGTGNSGTRAEEAVNIDTLPNMPAHEPRPGKPWLIISGAVVVGILLALIGFLVAREFMDSNARESGDDQAAKSDATEPAESKESADEKSEPAARDSESPATKEPANPSPSEPAPTPAAPASPNGSGQPPMPSGGGPMPMEPMNPTPPAPMSPRPTPPMTPPPTPAGAVRIRQVFPLPLANAGQQLAMDLKALQVAGAKPYVLGLRGLDSNLPKGASPARQAFQDSSKLLKVSIERSGGTVADIASFQIKDDKLHFQWTNVVGDAAVRPSASLVQDCVLEVKASGGETTYLALRAPQSVQMPPFPSPQVSTEKTEYAMDSARLNWPNLPARPLFIELDESRKPTLRNDKADVPIQSVSTAGDKTEVVIDQTRKDAIAFTGKAATYKFAKVEMAREISPNDARLQAVLHMARDAKIPTPKELAEERARGEAEFNEKKPQYDRDLQRAVMFRDKKAIEELKAKETEAKKKDADLRAKQATWQQDEIGLRKVKPVFTLTAGSVLMDVEGLRVEVYRFGK